MPRYENFEDLPVWQEAARLYNSTLDLLQKRGGALSPGFRNQLDRAALSVSNNIAEGFERITTAELLHYIGISRGSAGEVQSMMAVVGPRPELRVAAEDFQRIRVLAESCSRQLNAWSRSLEASPVQGKRHLSPEIRQRRLAAEKHAEFRRNFLRNLNPEHPLYKSHEARVARGEIEDD